MKKFVLLPCLCLALSACNTNELEFDNLEVDRINGVFGVPLGDITYTLGELLDEANIDDEALQEDENFLLSLSYSDTLSYENQDDFVQIDDISGDGFFLNTVTFVNVTTEIDTRQITPLIPYTQTYNPTNGEELDSVFHDGGQISVTVTSDAYVEGVTYTLQFENTQEVATRSALNVSGTVGRPANPGETSENTLSESLANHVTILSSNTNEFTVSFGAFATLAPGDELTGTETLTFNFTYAEQTFSVVYGKFGQTSAEVGNETLEFDFFNDLDDGIFFDAPTIRFNFTNTFGIPLALDFSGMSVDDGMGGNQTFLEGSITIDDFLPEIAAAVHPDSTATSTIEISSSNSNIRNLFATSPSRFLFNVEGISNYYDTDNSESNFVEPDNSVGAIVALEMPLAVRLDDFQESFRFDLSGGLDVDNIDSAFLRVVTVNGLPFSGTLAMEIQDENEEVLYSIPETVIVQTPFINVDGEVTDPNGNSEDIGLSKEAIDALEVGTYLNMLLTLNTPQTQTSNDIFVKVRTDYTINVTVGLGGLVNIGF